jgi:thiamine-phosphate pyrophosphorylase
MPEAHVPRSRLCLVTPHDMDLDRLVRLVGEALAGGDVASLIVDGDAGTSSACRGAGAGGPGPRGGRAGAERHPRRRPREGRRRSRRHQPRRCRGNRGKLRPKLIVGAGGARTRHDAMALGEANPDYLFFGRPRWRHRDGIFPKVLDLAAWWSSVFLSAMVMGGRSLASVEEAAAEGIEFVALSRAVFDDPRGPAAAVEEANRRLAGTAGPVA